MRGTCQRVNFVKHPDPNSDWIPEVLDVGGNWPRLTWKKDRQERYRVALVGGRAMPGQITYLSLDHLFEHKNTVVFGESGAGKTNLEGWWKRRINRTEQPWVSVAGPYQSYLTVSEDLSPYRDEIWSQLNPLFDFSLSPHDRGEAFYNVQTFLGQALGNLDLSFLFSDWAKVSRDFGAKGDEQRLLNAVFTAIRSYHEREDKPTSRVSILITSESVDENVLYESGFYGISTQYLLPGFALNECRLLMESCGLEPDREALLAIMGWVGGQPELLRNLTSQLLQLFGPGPFNIKEFLRASRSLRFRAKKSWIAQLKTMIVQDTSLGTRLLSYCKGIRRERPVAIEYDLFMTGWIGVDQSGLWAIRSKVHADMGREHLDRMNIREYS